MNALKWIKKNLPPLKQKWAMVTKSSEDKQFRHQMITFSEEKKNSSSNNIKNLKLVTKSIFHHQDVQIGDEIFILSL